MKCLRCQQDNPLDARFCLACGAKLSVVCASCGAELPGGARFCLQCGQPVTPGAGASGRSPTPESYTPKHLAEKILTSKAALEGERKQVTVLFGKLYQHIGRGELTREHLATATTMFREMDMRLWLSHT